MNKIAKNSPFAIALAVCAAAQTASATDGRYREYVVGERAGGMGGAALAVASDVDALFYNPAGLPRSQGDSLSLSANLYGLEHYKTKGGLDWGADEKSSTFVTIPAAMGGVKRFSDEWVGGFGVFAPKMEKRHLISASPNHDGLSHEDYNDQTLWIGPSIGWAPAGSRFSFGAGVFAIYRDCSITESTYLRNTYTLNGAMDLQTLGVLAAVGAQADLGDGWSVGATVQSPSARVWDDGELSINGTVSGDDGYDMALHTSDVRADNHIPWQVAAGIAKSGEYWCVALDAIWHPSSHYDLARWKSNGMTAAQTLHLRSVLDTSFGGEYVVAKKYPIRGGFYTAMSAVRLPDESDGTEFATSDVDMYGFTFSVGQRGELMSVNLGVDCAFGNGHELDYDDNGQKTGTPSDRRVFLASISTTYYF